LGDARGDTLTINGTSITITNAVPTGTDNTVLLLNGADNTIVRDEIDSRVWGTTLVDTDGTGTNNEIATWSDSNTIIGEVNLTFDGTVLTNRNDSGDIVCGTNGDVALTLNDGYGNANIAFNHKQGTPSQAGSSARIESSVDGTTAALYFEIKDNVSDGVATGLTSSLDLTETAAVFNEQGHDIDFRVESTGNTSAIRVDAANNRVGILDGTPSYNLDVNGTFRTTGNAILGDATADSHTINGKLTVTDDGGSTVAIETNGRFYSNSVNGGMWVGSGTNQFFGTRTSGATGKLGMFIGGQWRLIVDDNGYVGVGVDITPSYGLDVNASGTYGTIRATTDVIVTSDIRLKNELPDIVQGLEAVDKMRPIKYTLKDDEDENPKTHLGFSAQELLDIVPEVVSEDSEGIYNVAYQKLVPVLVKAIQELTEEVRELKKKVEE
jgi:hypothetical protein